MVVPSAALTTKRAINEDIDNKTIWKRGDSPCDVEGIYKERRTEWAGVLQ
jgi:hypothetical protein